MQKLWIITLCYLIPSCKIYALPQEPKELNELSARIGYLNQCIGDLQVEISNAIQNGNEVFVTIYSPILQKKIAWKSMCEHTYAKLQLQLADNNVIHPGT